MLIRRLVSDVSLVPVLVNYSANDIMCECVSASVSVYVCVDV